MGTQQSQSLQFGCVSCTNDDKSISQQDWKKSLKWECEQIREQCKWAKHLLKHTMKIIRSEPNQSYVSQFYAVNQQYKCQSIKNYRRSQSYSNRMVSSIKQNTEQSIKQIIKNTDFTLQQLEIVPNKNTDKQQISISLQLMENKQMQSIENEDNIILLQLAYYLEVMKLLKQQISNEDHQLNIMLHSFVDAFKKHYNVDRCKKQLENAIVDLQEFARVFSVCIVNYYDVDSVKMTVGNITNLFTTENITTSIISVLFSKEIISEIIYDMTIEYLSDNQMLNNFVSSASFPSQNNKFNYRPSAVIQQPTGKSDFDRFREILANLYDRDIGYFDVNVKFRLDTSTHSYLFKKFSNCEANFKGTNPYNKCIKLLKVIKEKQSPQQKYKALLHCLEKIMKQIKHFYNIHGCPFDQQIESSDLISIDMYIIIKSQFLDLPVHLFIIESFVFDSNSYGSYAYHFTSFKAAIKMILQLKY